MATLDDKLLGEKLHYYCSSSEDEEPSEEDKSAGNDLDGDGDNRRPHKASSNGPKFIPDSVAREWEGSSTNTGPKGVIRDWQRFKQLESERREAQEKEKLILAKKLAPMCQTHLDEEKEAQEKSQLSDEACDEDLDAVLKEFREKRIKELMQLEKSRKKVFGSVIEIESSEAYLTATEKNSDGDLLIILIYEDRASGCNSMKNCMRYLAAEYSDVKFCQMKASLVNLSLKFKAFGLPALLVYRNGELIGNYVQLVKEFGEDIYPTDVEGYLIEHGILQDRTLIPSALRCGTSTAASRADEDDD
ncbi:phosducin-like protein [Paramacrobiotus metropolitanus]|uniref:phosducin-like protein n=1 Tax=Paramacrobiotus metropolitanus TaxID=2943436 RepID=UPI0024460106|nr:phosducin-like protein [Paramacrobiotus metropolitanus]